MKNGKQVFDMLETEKWTRNVDLESKFILMVINMKYYIFKYEQCFRVDGGIIREMVKGHSGWKIGRKN